MIKETLSSLFESFNNMNVLLIGDVMVDSYIWGKVDRISPEAPVPIVSVQRSERRLGGAANVALNLKALGANPLMIAAVGNDAMGDEFIKMVRQEEMSTIGLLRSDTRITTNKTRIIGNSIAQLLRVDEELDIPLTPHDLSCIKEKIEQVFQTNDINVIVFEDYDKGLISPDLIQFVIEKAQQKSIPTVVDPKKRNFLNYQGVTLFKPNLKEMREGLNIPLSQVTLEKLNEAALKLNAEIKNQITLVTLSEKGVYISNEQESFIIPAHKRDIADVAGAGDTMVSVAALCLASKLNVMQIAQISNLAGGLVCEKVGVVPIEKSRLMEETQKLLGS